MEEMKVTVKLKDVVLWDKTPFGSSMKNRRFGEYIASIFKVT
jgi:hypothetical protein